jgi:hypothetical protein
VEIKMPARLKNAFVFLLLSLTITFAKNAQASGQAYYRAAIAILIIFSLGRPASTIHAENIAHDPFIRQELEREHWEPGGKHFPSQFSNRGSIVKRGGGLVLHLAHTHRIGGRWVQQLANISGGYNYTIDMSASHKWWQHSPFDVTHEASAEYKKQIEGQATTELTLQWQGIMNHPADGYDPPQGGGFPPPRGARDEFSFNISGHATGIYRLSPTEMQHMEVHPQRRKSVSIAELLEAQDKGQQINQIAGKFFPIPGPKPSPADVFRHDWQNPYPNPRWRQFYEKTNHSYFARPGANVLAGLSATELQPVTIAANYRRYVYPPGEAFDPLGASIAHTLGNIEDRLSPVKSHMELTAFILTTPHYEIRHELNKGTENLTLKEVTQRKSAWEKVPQWQTLYHDDGDEYPELKYTHPDGREVVFDGKAGEVVTDPRYLGTYNYIMPAQPPEDFLDIKGWEAFAKKGIGHYVVDVLPYLIGGNVRGRDETVAAGTLPQKRRQR